jgi:acid phosphatase
VVIGDWGTGEEGQKALGESIARTHADAPPAFVLTVGDNFYPDGVQSVDDPMWETHFESVYQGPFWEKMTFQAVLGNHDHYGVPEAQIEYSDVSDRWSMPGWYYALEKEVPGGGSVLFLALDTQPFSKEDSAATAIQVEWADSVLDGATADWVIVAGHHPAVTGGWHEPNEDVQTVVWPLIAGRSHLYVSGHNHSTELLETAIGVPQAVCGGGGGLDNAYRVSDTEETLKSFTNGGWCVLRFWPQAMAVELRDREGGIQYRYLTEK